MITIAAIQRAVCDEFGITSLDLTSARTGEGVARARQIGMYLARNMTTESLPCIGAMFGYRHHTTVMHAIQRIRELVLSDDEVFRRLSNVRGRVARLSKLTKEDLSPDWLLGQMGA